MRKIHYRHPGLVLSEAQGYIEEGGLNMEGEYGREWWDTDTDE